MVTLAYVLTGFSALRGLGVGLLGGILGYFFITGSYDMTSQVWGWGIILVALLYVAHPALAFWLIKTDRLVACYAFDVVFSLISVGLCVFLATGISASAR